MPAKDLTLAQLLRRIARERNGLCAADVARRFNSNMRAPAKAALALAVAAGEIHPGDRPDDAGQVHYFITCEHAAAWVARGRQATARKKRPKSAGLLPVSETQTAKHWYKNQPATGPVVPEIDACAPVYVSQLDPAQCRPWAAAAADGLATLGSGS